MDDLKKSFFYHGGPPNVKVGILNQIEESCNSPKRTIKDITAYHSISFDESDKMVVNRFFSIESGTDFFTFNTFLNRFLLNLLSFILNLY